MVQKLGSPFGPTRTWAALLIAWISRVGGKSCACGITRPYNGACGDEFGFGAFGWGRKTLLPLVLVSGCGALVVVRSAIAPVKAPAGEGICGVAEVDIAGCAGIDGALVASGGGAFTVYGGGGVGFITTNGGGPSLRFFSDVVLAVGEPKAVGTEREVGD